MASDYKKGMVLGVFDGLHEGHRHFLSDAQKKCVTLVVVVAQDSAVVALKGKKPRYPLEERITAISAYSSDLKVLKGDAVSGSWKILEEEKPDIVILGYDQEALGAELEKRAIPYMYMSAHEPHRFKSSKIGNETETPEI